MDVMGLTSFAHHSEIPPRVTGPKSSHFGPSGTLAISLAKQTLGVKVMQHTSPPRRSHLDGCALLYRLIAQAIANLHATFPGRFTEVQRRDGDRPGSNGSKSPAPQSFESAWKPAPARRVGAQPLVACVMRITATRAMKP